MNDKKLRIGIINSGGDCAGLNTVIASIVKAGVPKGHEFVGFIKGWEGLLDKEYCELDLDMVRGISHLGGTILRTASKGRFAGKKGMGDLNQIPDDILELASSNIREMCLDGLIVIGGDGTLSGAMQLSDIGVPIVGVPKSIDNDLDGTDKTFGFSTAVDVAADAIDKIHTTATSHDRVFFIECMGRHAGWISLYAGLAANANAILLPEFDVDIPSLVEFLRNRISQRGSAIVVVAEGIKLAHQNIEQSEKPEFILKGASEKVMSQIQEYCGDEFEMRSVVLGHTQRGGSPNAEDRMLSKRYGIAALEAFEAGEYGKMVCLRDSHIKTIPIMEATGNLRLVTHDCYEYQTAQKLGIFV